MLRANFGDRFMTVVIYTLLIFLAFITLYPFWNSVVISFNSGKDTMLGGITFWPREFTLENYNVVFEDKRIIKGFMITISRTVIGTVVGILATSLFAYGLSRRGLIFRKYYMVMAVVTMYFTGGLIPNFLLIRGLGLMDTFWVMILPVMINVWNMIIFMTFFRSIPAGLEEAAKLDGCGTWSVFFRIVLPLSGPVIATLGLFTAVQHWNEWFLPSIYLNNTDLYPVQTLLRQILNSNIMSEQLSNLDSAALTQLSKMQSITTKSLSMATMVVSTLPVMLIYPFVQKYFSKGVMIGSLKE
ncbi:carbohydrate ABC transporter permease [Paenibacillus chitinolyticus]